jgi:hypothetical protein
LFVFIYPIILFVLRQIGIRAELDQKKKKKIQQIVGQTTHTKKKKKKKKNKTKLQSKSTKPTHTMTKITFIYLPHEICAATAEAAAKTAAPTNIPKQKEKAIVKPNNHLPSRL